MKRIDDNSIVSWNGYFYGKVIGKKNARYYKSYTVRFDDTMGGTEEITFDEYITAAEKYAAVFERR